MAKDMQTKKRKASVPEVESEKVKVKNVVATPVEAPAKKRKATEDAAPVKVKKTKTPKDVSEAKATTSIASDKASKKTISTTTPENEKEVAKEAVTKVKKAIAPKSKKVAASKEKVVPKSKKEAKPAKPEIEVDEEMDSSLKDEDKNMDEDSDSEVDEKTEKMLLGFESDGDDEEINDGLPEGATVPIRKQLSKKEEKRLSKIKDSGASDKPGVVYLGRIPHGFYENEMKAYFGQFGNILKLRLSRNKKTGASKHYAFIQFASADVADIVARTMDNYMMFSHLLKVKLIPDEQVNPDWFKGANKRFKRVPWNKMQGRKLEQGKSEEDWNSKNALEADKREKKAAKLKEIGYEFEAPKLKSAAGIAKPKEAEEPSNAEGGKAIEATPVVEASKSKKKGKKAKDIEVTPVVAAVPEVNPKKEHRAISVPPPKEDVEESINALIAEAAAKPEKGKKAKVVKEAEIVLEETVAAVEEPKPKKGKAAKVVKAGVVVLEETVAVVEEPKSKKEKKGKKAKAAEAVEIIPAPAVEVPGKKLKTKKSKTSLVETTVTPVVAPEEPVKKSKKRKASS